MIKAQGRNRTKGNIGKYRFSALLLISMLLLANKSTAGVDYLPKEIVVKKQNHVEHYYLKASKSDAINREEYLRELNNTINRLKRAKKQLLAGDRAESSFSTLPSAVHEVRYSSGDVIATLDGKVLGVEYDDSINRVVILHFVDDATAYEIIIEQYDKLRAMPLFFASENCTGSFYASDTFNAAIAENGGVLIPDANAPVAIQPKSALFNGECASGEDYKYRNSDTYYLYRHTDLVIKEKRIIRTTL